MSKILVAYYSCYGHTYELAKAVSIGARSAGSADVRVRRIPELQEVRAAMSAQEAYRNAQAAQKDIPEATHDDLRWADGIIWGTPSRYGNMSAQMKQFLDTTEPLWLKGELESKATGVFTSTATTHGGQETTIITSLVPLLHLGMVLVGTPYGENPQLLTAEGLGGSPYGAGTVTGLDRSRMPAEQELQTARNLGARVTRVASALASIRPQQDDKTPNRTRAA